MTCTQPPPAQDPAVALAEALAAGNDGTAPGLVAWESDPGEGCDQAGKSFPADVTPGRRFNWWALQQALGMATVVGVAAVVALALVAAAPCRDGQTPTGPGELCEVRP
jgi:hypothetical protein